jgi:hypothetical protein
MASNTCYLGLSTDDARHRTYRIRCVVRGGSVAPVLPYRVCREFNFSAEGTEFLLVTHSDGSMTLRPQARAKPWALLEGDEK